MPRLILITPDGRQEVELRAQNSLGRHPNNSIQVLDRIVSKEHCTIEQRNDRFYLHDLGSLNGTYLNGERVVEDKPLKHQDEIVFGSTRAIFQDGISAAAPNSRVTMGPGVMESHIRAKLAAVAEQSFMPEKAITDVENLRRDYEKLRVSWELQRAIGLELNIDNILRKILDRAFEMLPADRGVILLHDEHNELRPRAIKQRRTDGDEEIVLSTTIINEVLRDKAAVLSNDATVDSRFHGAHSIIMQGIRSSMAVPLLHSDKLLGIMLLDSQIATNAFTEKDLQLFQNIANQAAIALENSYLAQRIEQEAVTREKFMRLLSPAIAEQVISGKVEVKKGGELRGCTVLFSDIRGFTRMSESRTPQDIVSMLNEYFELMVEIIFRHEGTLDKFVGDEIMALFGAPVAHEDDPLRAVTVALEMMRVLGEFNRTRMAEGQEPLKIGVGINSGETVAGYIGSSRALEYTVIGDTVNTASRLCGVAKAGEILIAENVFQIVKDAVEVVELPPAQVKGKSLPLKVYNVLGFKTRPMFDDRTRPGVPPASPGAVPRPPEMAPPGMMTPPRPPEGGGGPGVV
ncbi:MAG: GAF domain-containing protein [Deltaproteobacteria bacterium]|nr:GAF domain-containing protein [Deltaproteobacteria bacterium]